MVLAEPSRAMNHDSVAWYSLMAFSRLRTSRFWHMANYAGCDIGFVNPDTGIAAGEMMDFSHAIVVGSDGHCFRNEANPGVRHGKVYTHGAFDYLPMPETMFCILDEEGRKAAPLYPTWSDGNEDELAAGWLTAADAIEELAAQLGLDGAVLAETIERYNRSCAAGVDEEQGRAADTLFPVATAPFYGFPVDDVLWNTLGGPERNAQCEIGLSKDEIDAVDAVSGATVTSEAIKQAVKEAWK